MINMFFDTLFSGYASLAIIFCIPAFFLLFNVSLYKLDFSALGPYKRMPIPEGEPLVVVESSSISIGLFSASGIVKWSIFPEGIGINIPLAGKAFLPVTHIKRISSHFLSYKIEHTSPEIRGPIKIPKKVANTVSEHLGMKIGR